MKGNNQKTGHDSSLPEYLVVVDEAVTKLSSELPYTTCTKYKKYYILPLIFLEYWQQ